MRRKFLKRKRKVKTFEEILELHGTEFYLTENGIVFYLENVGIGEQIYLGELLAKFYRLNEDQAPLVFRFLNDPRQAIPEKVWYAVMRGNFYIEVIEGRDKAGPHQTKLWFKSFTDRKSHWIATLQLMAFYYNEDEVRETLLKAIANREFFMSDQTRDKAIVP
jgi:hypothetical protein